MYKLKRFMVCCSIPIKTSLFEQVVSCVTLFLCSTIPVFIFHDSSGYNLPVLPWSFTSDHSWLKSPERAQ